jgi:putative PIN family toxin of toxin-antitoxin system
MLRITPDVNLLVEATISSSGPAGAILAAWRAGRLELALCSEIIAEYEDVLNRPRIRNRYASITAESIAASVNVLRQRGDLVQVGHVPRIVHDDPDDDVTLACALDANVDYVVTRDQHLLRLTRHQTIPILSPSDFLPVLRRSLERLEEP